MDFRLHRLSNYSDDALIAELKRVASLAPRGPLTRAVFAEYSRSSASTAMKRFGGWRQALEAAGLGSRYSGQPVSERMRQQPGKSVTREDVVEELRRVAAKLGRKDLTVDDFNSHASFSVAAVRSFFKPWRRALEAAGLTARPTSVRYTDEERYENLLRVWTHLGRPPQYREMNSPPSQVGGKAYVGRWGSWLKALEAFVERVNEDDAPKAAVSESGEVVVSATPTDIVKGDDGRIRLGLRYKTLVRDNFKLPALRQLSRHGSHLSTARGSHSSVLERWPERTRESSGPLRCVQHWERKPHHRGCPLTAAATDAANCAARLSAGVRRQAS